MTQWTWCRIIGIGLVLVGLYWQVEQYHRTMQLHTRMMAAQVTLMTIQNQQVIALMQGGCKEHLVSPQSEACGVVPTQVEPF